ncbi:hypothetical protein PIB30_010198 [Stylosanthes scabra]|uniref:Ubiquitin-like protease family profile domain-containing protein n=1 Tax=Stylosanthes scabra TaxID=79078 RepID=A0ABU6R514_9FABA|nr:hypothetical protein [Stylosanthes scabra]
MAKKAELKSKNPPMRVPHQKGALGQDARNTNQVQTRKLLSQTRRQMRSQNLIQNPNQKLSRYHDERFEASGRMIVLWPLFADSDRLVDFVKRTKRRKSQRIANTHKKQKLDQLNEVDRATRSPSETRMFDTFDTVSLRRDDSDHVVVEGPVVTPTQPSQPEKENEHHENMNEAGVDDKEAGVAVPLDVDEVILEAAQPQGLSGIATEDAAEHTEIDPEPISIQIPFEYEAGAENKYAGADVVLEEAQPQLPVVIIPVQPEQASESEVEAPHNAVEEEKEPEKQSEVEPDPINVDNPFEPELTLKPWLNPDTETTDAKGTTDLTEEIITDVLLSMKQEDKGEEGNQELQPGDQEQCNTPEAAPASMEERCFIWATTENNNKYDTIFQLRGPNTLEAMREQVHRFQREVYCVPPEILIRMFETHGTNFMDKKTKKPVRFTDLKDKQFFQLLDKEKLRMSRVCNVLDQFRVWARAKSLIKKGSNTLQLRHIDVPKQPNPTDCGVYVMKWMETLDTHALSFAYTFKKTCMIEEWDQDQLDGFMEKIVAKVLLSEHNTLNFEAMNKSRTMTREAITEGRTKLGRRTKPSAALKSPFLNPSTVELEKKQ